jgi:hypothetical protein
VGNIVTGTDQQTQKALDAGMLQALPQLLRHPKSSVQKEATWALSNVAAGPPHHIQQLIASDILPALVALLKSVSVRPACAALGCCGTSDTGDKQNLPKEVEDPRTLERQ